MGPFGDVKKDTSIMAGFDLKKFQNMFSVSKSKVSDKRISYFTTKT